MDFSPLKFDYGQNCPAMRVFMSITASNAKKKKLFLDMRKNGEKPKILITESVIFANHSTVFSVGESPNLKPTHDISSLKMKAFFPLIF